MAPYFPGNGRPRLPHMALLPQKPALVLKMKQADKRKIIFLIPTPGTCASLWVTARRQACFKGAGLAPMPPFWLPHRDLRVLKHRAINPTRQSFSAVHRGAAAPGFPLWVAKPGKFVLKIKQADSAIRDPFLPQPRWAVGIALPGSL